MKVGCSFLVPASLSRGIFFEALRWMLSCGGERVSGGQEWWLGAGGGGLWVEWKEINGPRVWAPSELPSPYQPPPLLAQAGWQIQVDSSCRGCLAHPPAKMAVVPHLLCPLRSSCATCAPGREKTKRKERSLQGPKEAATHPRTPSYLVAHPDPSSQAGFLFSQGQTDRRWAASLATQSSHLPSPPSFPPWVPSLISSKASFPLPFLRSRSFISQVQNSGLKSGQKFPPSFPTDHMSSQVLLEMDSSTGAWEAQTSAGGAQDSVFSKTGLL